jgi:hypothetical protein
MPSLWPSMAERGTGRTRPEEVPKLRGRGLGHAVPEFEGCREVAGAPAKETEEIGCYRQLPASSFGTT